MFSPCNSKFTLAEVVAVEAVEADVGAEVVEEAVAHVPAGVVSRHQPLLPDQPRLPGRLVPARPLGQVLVAPRLVPAPPVAHLVGRLRRVAVLVVRLRKEGVLPGKLPKVALDQAALRQGKVLPLRSVPAEQVQTSQAAVHRLAR